MRAPNRAGLPEVLELMQLLLTVMQGLKAASNRMNAFLGVTGQQRIVLRGVGLFPGVSVKELAAALQIQPSTLARVLQRLLAQRLIVRIANPHDGRRIILRLTARGHRATNRRRGTVEAAVAAALARVNDADRRATRRVLTELAAVLCSPSGDLQGRSAQAGGPFRPSLRSISAHVGPRREQPGHR